ncbi:mg2+ transporter zinc transport protein [Diplodia corticola]|uniref:Mg2+ transporter zinc transport protein n=1 Tax=Diplodia corticola TaxID=236234 RepID=A0A1J9RME0_9PEZI|nr:mg2+ transporter zinc transport protein [Diplodia corticola]OJD33747.1 mg2+ transporter zinc transport protein [Diplodia corticola]
MTSEDPGDKPPPIEWQDAPGESDHYFRKFMTYDRLECKPTAEELDTEIPENDDQSEHNSASENPVPKIPVSDDRLRYKSIPESLVTSIPESFPEKARNRRSYVSFGSEGTTASVNASGHIMQISRYLGYGRSGFFSADQKGTRKPFYVDTRKQHLMELAKDPFAGFRLDLLQAFEGLVDYKQCKPSVKFIHDRWPWFNIRDSRGRKDNPHPEEQGHRSEKQREEKDNPYPEEQGVQESNKQRKEKNIAYATTFSVQYFCHNGTIFQRHLVEFDKTEFPSPDLSRLRLDAAACIRNLDFVHDTDFNDDDESPYRSGPNHRSLIVVHKMNRNMANDMGIDNDVYSKGSGPKAAALIITPFTEGRAQKVTQLGEADSSWYIELDKKAEDAIKESGKLDITLAYRLQLIEEDQKWENSTVPGHRMTSMGEAILSESSLFRKIIFSRNEHLDFVIRRNLEHTLSVCSVPILQSPVLGHTDEDLDNLAVALTCGDISGHRVSTRASVSAFMFLHSMLKYLAPDTHSLRPYLANPTRCSCGDQQSPCDECSCVKPYLDHVYGRIQTTLRGHLVWVCTTSKGEEGSFAPHYWPTGKHITNLSWLPSATLLDTPLQLLKVLWFKERSLPSDQQTELAAKVRPWLSHLDKTNNRGSYAFSVDPGNLSEKFKFADHVLICLAIRCVQHLEERSAIFATREEELGDAEDPGALHIFNTYSFQEVRRNVLKRFTVQGPITKQRMLATRRTPSESRFLLHSKDTILFHIMDLKLDKEWFEAEESLEPIQFFQREEKLPRQRKKGKGSSEADGSWKYIDDRWKATVDAQAYHDEYQNLEWGKPLWYALTFILGCKRRRINKSSIDETLRVTSSVLLGASSMSGLFAGLLDEDQEPIPFENEMDQDSFWHAAFETPYVLWTYGRDYFDAQWAREKEHQSGGGAPKSPSDVTGDPTGVKQGQRASNIGDTAAPFKDAGRIGQIITKGVPFVNFSTLIDQKGLVEVSDDWLQDGPVALDFGFRPDFSKLKDLRCDPSEKVITAGLEAYKRSPTSSFFTEERGIVIDVIKRSEGDEMGAGGDEIGAGQQETNDGIKKCLGRRRTVQFAKKRLIWLPNGNKETAVLCYFASPEPERGNMAHFFDRHASHEKYFFDGATAALNEWETEIHFSFFKLVQCQKEDVKEILQTANNGISSLSFLKLGERREDGGSSQETVFLHSTMSFRFVGDFFDRFWTCHFLDPGQKDQQSLQARLSNFHHTVLEGSKKNPWQQRKVLELLLFYEMLESMHENTHKILEWVKHQVLNPPNLEKIPRPDLGEDITTTRLLQEKSVMEASMPLNPLASAFQDGYQLLKQGTSENYFSIIESWRLFEQILQALEDDLSGNIERIDQWNKREEDRKSERPRWTRNDEKRYRTAITKVTVLNDRRGRDIVRLRATIKAFRESLPGRLESIRSDISFRGSENINLFTYVTVVFLPLGFATGIFSMSNAPSRQTLVSMIELALMAMAITIFALANVKTTGKTLVRPLILAFREVNDLLLHPPLRILQSFIQNHMPVVALYLFSRLVWFFYRFVWFPLTTVNGRIPVKTPETRWYQKTRLKELWKSFKVPMRAIPEPWTLDPVKEASEDYAQMIRDKRADDLLRKLRKSGLKRHPNATNGGTDFEEQGSERRQVDEELGHMPRAAPATPSSAASSIHMRRSI